MRVVRTLADLPAEIATAEAEAASAFGDGTVFVEPYVEHGRHVEVQVLGHRDGVLVLGERDCSIQRRHQKVVEEAPAPNLPEKTRRALHEAARNAAAAIDYRGAGTVEFLYDADSDRFFFLEMNTRLQVEHPVTELVHGVDLVDLQLTVAEGRPLDQRVIGETYGHSIEVRLYAEDPAADWQPQSGLLTLVDVPGVSGEFDLLNRPGIRLDSGFETGSEVSTHYDAMLAKVIAWAPTREQAARRWPTRSPGRGCTASPPTATCWSRSCVTRRSWPGRSAPTSSTAARCWPRPSRCRPTSDLLFAAAVALAEQDRLGTAGAGRRTRGLAQRRLPTAAHDASPWARRSTRSDWYGGRDGYRSTDPAVHVLSASPDEVVLEVGGVPCATRSRQTRGHKSGSRPVRRHLSRSTADLCPRVCGKSRASSTRPTWWRRGRCSRRCRAR